MAPVGRKEFKARLEGAGPGGAWTVLKIPSAVRGGASGRDRIAVRGTLNGFAFRGPIFPTGDGTHILMVDRALQAGARAEKGDLVTLSVEPELPPRAAPLPREFREALARDRKARDAFEALPPSHRREYVDWIREARKAETRARRIDRTLASLRRARKAR